MATARPTLAADAPRDHRQEGRPPAPRRPLPAVVYGHGDASDQRHGRRPRVRAAPPARRPERADRPVVDGKKAQPVLVHGVQVHPVNRRPLHVDLFLVRMTEELTVDVPLVAIGHRTGRRARSAARCSTRSSRVSVQALPDHLPQSIEYSIESLVDFDATIHVRDLTIPGDVTLLTDLDEIVAKVQPPRVEVEEVPVVAEGEEGPRAKRVPRARRAPKARPPAAPARATRATRADARRRFRAPARRAPRRLPTS